MSRRILAAMLGVPIMIVAIVGCTSGGANESQPVVTVTVTVTAEPPPAVPDPEAVKPADVQVELEVTSKQCFGSAGCNVTVEPVLTSSTEAAIAGGYRITYEISGDESGPIIETIEVNTDGTYSYSTTIMSTASTDVVPTATVTSIRPD